MLQRSIRFHSEDVSFKLHRISPTRGWLLNAIASEKKTISHIDFIWCSDAYLLQINLNYLKHNTLTDIITFDYGVESCIGGDIFISVERVKDNASIFNTKFYHELHRIMIHGVLHLCGYSDKTAVQKSEMTEKEDYYLSLLTF